MTSSQDGEDEAAASVSPQGNGEPPHVPTLEPNRRPKTSLSSVKLATFKGDKRNIDQFKQWKKSIQAHVILYQLEEGETAMLLYLATEDAARDTLNVMSIEDMKAPGGLTH
eukprot:4909161-Amphidinium_carterae.1